MTKEAGNTVAIAALLDILTEVDSNTPEIWTYKGKGIYSMGQEGIQLPIDSELEFDNEPEMLEGLCKLRNAVPHLLRIIEALNMGDDVKAKVIARNYVREEGDDDSYLEHKDGEENEEEI